MVFVVCPVEMRITTFWFAGRWWREWRLPVETVWRAVWTRVVCVEKVECGGWVLRGVKGMAVGFMVELVDDG